VEFKPTGLVFTQKLTHEQWKNLGCELRVMYKSSLWWIGDWLAYGHRMLNITEEEREMEQRQLTRIERGIIDEVANEMGMSKGRLHNLKSAAMRVIPSRRREDVTMTHAIEILSVVPDSQYEYWADKVSKDRLSTRELRGELRKSLATETASPISARPQMFIPELLEVCKKAVVESNTWSQAQKEMVEHDLEPFFAIFGPISARPQMFIPELLEVFKKAVVESNTWSQAQKEMVEHDLEPFFAIFGR
jgi:hypothetical protein